jgi:cytochrome c oxidase subunit 3
MSSLTVSQIYEKYERKHSSLGMTIMLISLMMLFASLFMAYAIYRFQNSTWPPMGFEKVSLFQPIISTVFILLSSLTYHFAYSNFALKKKQMFKWLMFSTCILGTGFLVSQLILWRHLTSTGLYVESGIFSSILHAFTWIHAAHVVAAIATLVFYIFPICFSKKDNDNNYSKIMNVGRFWHFLGVIWILMFVFIFVI